jgi:membrane protein
VGRFNLLARLIVASGNVVGKYWKLVKEAASGWIDDAAPSMGAALAYYTVFSIAPLLLLLIALAGLFFGDEAARGEIVGQLGGMMGKEGASAIEGLLKSTSDTGGGIIATIVSFVTLLIGATTVFGELQTDLDRIWKAPKAARPEGIWGLIRTRILSFGLILGIGFVLIVSLALSTALAALGKWWSGAFGNWTILLQVVNFVVSFGVITAMFALVNKFMPSVPVQWRDVWIGSAVTALLFTIGKFLIGLYIGKSSIASGFGAAGSLIVVLVWVYYSTQIFLLGAEFTYVYAHREGSRVGQPEPTKGAGQNVPEKAPVQGSSPQREPAPQAARTQPQPAGVLAYEPPRPVVRDAREIAAAANAARAQAVIKLGTAMSLGWVVGYLASSERASELASRLQQVMGDRMPALPDSLSSLARRLKLG